MDHHWSELRLKAATAGSPNPLPVCPRIVVSFELSAWVAFAISGVSATLSSVAFGAAGAQLIARIPSAGRVAREYRCLASPARNDVRGDILRASISPPPLTSSGPPRTH